jgi:hypothetical protein
MVGHRGAGERQHRQIVMSAQLRQRLVAAWAEIATSVPLAPCG